MFIETVIFSILIGYLLKGRLKNIDIENIKGISLVICAFAIKFALVMCIQKGLLKIGMITVLAYMVQYGLVFLFVFLNRRDPLIVVMGVGILLNAVVIFANNGTMPVNLNAAHVAGLKTNVDSEGLYRALDSNTRLGFLGDIIPKTILRHFVISIGDIVTAVGLALYIILGMKKTACN